MREREANEPRWDASQSWEGWRALGPALAERYAAGLPPMPEWAWRPIGAAPGWVALEFVGPRMNEPIGAGVYLRKANGAILLIGSAVFFYGTIESDDDFAAAVADFPPDADPALIEAHIRLLLEARLEKLEAAGEIKRLGRY